MTQDNEQEVEIADADIRSGSGVSVVWLIPVLTLLVGGWLIFSTLAAQGPTVEIRFKTANGIEAGKTRVKYRNVDIGLVEALRFSDDLSDVVLTVKFNDGTENFLRRNTNFWVVTPQLSIRGVSGLSTLVSGAYIEIDPGQGAAQRSFVGLEKAPLVTSNEAGQRVTLLADDLGSVDSGSPIYYHGVLAGEVLGYELASDSDSVFVYAFVRDPYHRLIRSNTRFWNVSGVKVEVGADGLKLETESLQSLMFGGLAFDTPESLAQLDTPVDDLVFTLHSNYESVEAQAFTRKLRYVMYFDRSVRGLNTGAPVEFKGLRIGKVLDIRLEYDSADTSFRIPVLVEIEPERIIDREAIGTATAEKTLAKLIDRGLRASLQTGSLLTGQLFVDLNMYPDAPTAELVAQNNTDYAEMPTIAGGLETIQRTIENFVTKLDDIDLGEISENLVGVLEGGKQLLAKPEIDSALVNLDASMRSLRNIMRDVDRGDVDQIMIAARDSLQQLEQTMILANTTLDPDSPLQYNITRMTGELEDTARAIRSLVETLERRPESLIFGREQRKRR